jgi:hypothetical protein
MRNTVFWDVTPCGSCNNRRIGGIYRLRHQGGMVKRSSGTSVDNNLVGSGILDLLVRSSCFI